MPKCDGGDVLVVPVQPAEIYADRSRPTDLLPLSTDILDHLPSYVGSANTLNCFKSRLDKYWYDQYSIYCFRAEGK